MCYSTAELFKYFSSLEYYLGCYKRIALYQYQHPLGEIMLADTNLIGKDALAYIEKYQVYLNLLTEALSILRH